MTFHHNSTMSALRAALAAWSLSLCVCAGAVVAPNDPPDLGVTPPDLTQSVDPNIVVTFDDSGSMTSNYMGDVRPFDGGGWGGATPQTNPWFCAGTIDPRVTNSANVLSKAMNGVYYNPNVIYQPPLSENGTPFADADATLAAVWADGIAVKRPTGAVAPAGPGYHNNPNSTAGGNDTQVTILNGVLVANTATAGESCKNNGAPVCLSNTNLPLVCGPAQRAGGTISGCSCSGLNLAHKCNWTDTYPTGTVTDKRWICGSAAGSPTAGINPKYPTAFFDGTDVTLGGPYYYRYAGPVITVDVYGNPNAAGKVNLYTKTNWEAVPITNTTVTINGKSINQWQNFANWYAYYRTRNLMTRTALSRVFGVLGDNIRVAWQNINSNLITANTIITNLNNTASPNYRKNFFDWIFATGANGGTPDRASTIRAGDFFTRNSKNLKDPYYDPGVNDDLGCRQNFHMLVTDGYWNEGNPALPGAFFTAAAGPPGGVLPDAQVYDPAATQTRIYWDTQPAALISSLANIGFYYWATDLRPDLAPPKTVATPYASKVPPYNKDFTTGITAASAAGYPDEIYFNPANDPATWRHVVQFMVTLGVAGNLQYSNDVDCVGSDDLCALRTGVNNSTGVTGWPQPVNNSPPAIDDTWHAAVNSRGSYFSASNPATLVSHLTDIINSIVARSGQSSAESVSTSILNQGAVGYQGGYNSSGWSGYLYKQKLDPVTAAPLGTPVWDAGCLLTGGLCAATGLNVGAATPPTSRIIFTSVGAPGSLVGKPFEWGMLGATEQAALSLDPSTTHPDLVTTQVPAANGTADVNGSYRVDYLRGDRSYEAATTPTAQPVKFRSRASVLGAIINSQAVYEGAPSSGYQDTFPVGSPEQTAAAATDSYEKFVSTYLTRNPMVYVGANDGMLHAFDAGSGAETWSYMPNALFANGQMDQTTNPANGLVVSVDDTPIVKDVFTNGQWRTMLVGSLRLGGRGIFALDVTDSSAPGSEATAAGKFLWEFTSQQDPDLGYTYASANIARLHCNIAPCSGVGSPGGTWVVIVSGGYFPKALPVQDNGNGVVDGAAGVTGTTSYMWVLNASDGSVIAKLATTSGVTSYGMSVPVVVDFGLNQVDDIAVAGDLAGNLWRFDLSSPDPTVWSSKVDNLFRTYTSTAACTGANTHGIGCEPITVLPVAFGDAATGSVIYVFGSGEYLGNTDRTSASVYTPQHFFGVRDYGTGFAGYPFHEDDLNTQTLTQDVAGDRSLTYSPTASINSPSRGWQIPLNVAGISGERDVASAAPLYSIGAAILVSLIPGSNNDPCNPGRVGAILAINAGTGGPVVPSPTGALTGVVGFTVTNPPAVGSVGAISVLGGGKIILPGMGSNTDPTKPPEFDSLTPIWRRTSWNELLNDL